MILSLLDNTLLIFFFGFCYNSTTRKGRPTIAILASLLGCTHDGPTLSLPFQLENFCRAAEKTLTSNTATFLSNSALARMHSENSWCVGIELMNMQFTMMTSALHWSCRKKWIVGVIFCQLCHFEPVLEHL